MTGDKDFQQSVNKNENHMFCWAPMVDRQENARLVSFIPKANYLIQKYAAEWWKNHPGEWDYQYLQYQLCTLMDDYTRQECLSVDRASTIHYCAFLLRVNRLLLHNDKDLPF